MRAAPPKARLSDSGAPRPIAGGGVPMGRGRAVTPRPGAGRPGGSEATRRYDHSPAWSSSPLPADGYSMVAAPARVIAHPPYWGLTRGVCPEWETRLRHPAMAYDQAMPRLACMSCGRTLWATAPLAHLFAEERRCPWCQAPLQDDRRVAVRRQQMRREIHASGSPTGDERRVIVDRRKVRRRRPT